VARTGFALEGKHVTLTCRQCHLNLSPSGVPLPQQHVDFGGAKTACASCHMDPHKGDNGPKCQACHRTTTFDVKSFTHPRQPDFYRGQHAQVTCVGCHVPEGRLRPTRVGGTLISFAPATPTMECRTCHNDVHLGQLGAACESCHDIGAARFAPAGFSHGKTHFPLAGRHALLECVSCHAEQTGQFPAGVGKAKRYAPMLSTCRTCHEDPHLGQLSETCETCHGNATFTMATFVHRGMDDFFGGFHGGLTCQSCHKQETGVFPARRGTAVRYRLERTCAACHKGF
jgi:hypothetical protein